MPLMEAQPNFHIKIIPDKIIPTISIEDLGIATLKKRAHQHPWNHRQELGVDRARRDADSACT